MNVFNPRDPICRLYLSEANTYNIRFTLSAGDNRVNYTELLLCYFPGRLRTVLRQRAHICNDTNLSTFRPPIRKYFAFLGMVLTIRYTYRMQAKMHVRNCAPSEELRVSANREDQNTGLK